jgi:SEC-C motif-containing protein
MSQPCRCGSGKQGSECCANYLNGQQIPASPEQLMRSRYCAFAAKNEAYLLQTWHPSTRPPRIPFDQATDWLGLDIQGAGMVSDDEGWVQFNARYRVEGEVQDLHETSRFLRQAGRWYYLDGEHHQPVKTGRNQACPCGSGKKYKRCCGR